LDLRTPQHVHIVGIGGAGMSAIALVLRALT
jgi:UDP-N-acetylmuramate-alanine ligase